MKYLVLAAAMLAMVTGASAADYYTYGVFPENSPAWSPHSGIFRGGHGVAGYITGDASQGYPGLLVIDNGTVADIYRVTLSDGDDDGVIQRNQHPDNPDATGSVEPRTLTYLGSYDYGTDIGYSSGWHISEQAFVMTSSEIYLGSRLGIHKWTYDPSDPTNWFYVGQIGPSLNDGETFAYDEDTGTFYSGNWNREIYSWKPGQSSWQHEFTYLSYGGWHHDGLTFAGGYLVISDMTSNKIGLWKKEGGNWVEKYTFTYTEVVDDDVEGMGYGPAGHLWVTGWDYLYELGGGKLDIITTIPEPSSFLLFAPGLLGLGAYARARFGRRKK